MRTRIARVVGLSLALGALALASALVLPTTTESTRPSGILLGPRDRTPAHPLGVEIQQLLNAQHDRLEPLRSRLAAGVEPDEDLAIQREIQRIKIETDIAMLRIQLRHAEETGNLRTAGTLRSTLESYRNLGRRRATEPIPVQAPAGEEVAP